MTISNLEFAKLVANLLNEKLGADSYLESCSFYGEKGYIDPDQCILFANWNDIPDNVQEVLADNGYELEWSDEWYIDSDNNKAYRSEPSSYGWQPLISFQDGYILTPDDDIGKWLEALAVTDYAQSHTAFNSSQLAAIGGNITDEGYVLLSDPETPFQAGLHSHMTDNPSEISKALFETIDGLESLVYLVTDSSQFNIDFEVYGKISE